MNQTFRALAFRACPAAASWRSCFTRTCRTWRAGETGRSTLDSYRRQPAGFGTWPFGEELLLEAIASSYLPLLDVLDEHPAG